MYRYIHSIHFFALLLPDAACLLLLQRLVLRKREQWM
jgi:hypothetical protein